MRITDIAVDLIPLPAQPHFRWRAGLPGAEGETMGGIVRITTDEGLVGEARTRRGVVVADLVDRVIKPDLLGTDPLKREHAWHRMWELNRREQFPLYALGLVDVALWDLAGKATNLPIHRLAGGFRDSLPAYASTVTHDSIDEYLDVADQCLEAGFRAIKIHAWGDARRDAVLCEKLRSHVGEQIELMYDGSAAFMLADAVYLGRELAELGFRWYEEPMCEFSTIAYGRLGELVDVPLLVGEIREGAHMSIADFIATGCAQYVRTSPHLKGGITGALRIAHLADAYLMNAEVHGSGQLQRHLCMAIPNTTYYECLLIGNPIRVEECIGHDGMIHAPTAPGIGYEHEMA